MAGPFAAVPAGPSVGGGGMPFDGSGSRPFGGGGGRPSPSLPRDPAIDIATSKVSTCPCSNVNPIFSCLVKFC
jgi:hypothetical protein